MLKVFFLLQNCCHITLHEHLKLMSHCLTCGTSKSWSFFLSVFGSFYQFLLKMNSKDWLSSKMLSKLEAEEFSGLEDAFSVWKVSW